MKKKTHGADDSRLYFFAQIVFTEIDWFQTAAWQGKIERIKREGIDQLPLNWLIGSVVGSAIQTLLVSLIVPYVVSLFLGAFGATYAIQQRLVWPAFFLLIITCFICRLFERLFIYVRKVEYDRLYLVGHELMNYDSDTDSYVWGCDRNFEGITSETRDARVLFK